MSKSLLTMMQEVRDVNEANGWFGGVRSFGDDIALLHSEVSEAFEAFRDNGLADMTGPSRRGPDADHPVLPKPEGVGSEFADILIRLLDSCDRASIDLEAEYTRKLAYNRTRGYKHGGKAV